MVLRRSLVAWGLGHLALGQSRGWLLLGLEILWVAAFVVALPLLPTDRWLLAYGLLAGFIVAWFAQAVAAYRLAGARLGHGSGAGWLLAIAPVVIALLTGFWLFAAGNESPAATFQRYVGAWRHGDAAAAASLFAQPLDSGMVKATWERQERLISQRIAALADADPEFSLDRVNPETNLRFDLHDPGNGPATAVGRVQFDVHVVRQVTVPSTVLGIVTASRTEIRVVETIGQALLVRRPLQGALAATGAGAWFIESMRFAGEP